MEKVAGSSPAVPTISPRKAPSPVNYIQKGDYATT
jgi:hypothetical protein